MSRLSAQRELDANRRNHYQLSPEKIHYLTLIATEDHSLADKAKAEATLLEPSDDR